MRIKKIAVGGSIIHPRLEELDALSAPASLLRRRLSISRVTKPMDDAENDDETECFQRRLEKNQPQAGKTEKHRSLELAVVSKMSNPQIANGMMLCMKLSAENKINVKNAFSLEMIDFMTNMINECDGNTNNLQVTSTWLDVSAKIYGFRVDSIHMDTMKMIGSLDKQKKSHGKQDGGFGAENPESGRDNDIEGDRTQRVKRKRSKQKILSSAESLRAPLDMIKPNVMMIGESDSQTTNMLFQAILPVHANSDLFLHPYDDVILDTVNPMLEAGVNDSPVYSPCLERFGHLDLCPSFANFEFLGWSVEEELELASEVMSQPLVEDDDFQLDLEASLPAKDVPGPLQMNYFEMEDDDNENIEVHDNMNMQSILQRYLPENIGGCTIVEGCTQESNTYSVDAVMTFDAESLEAALDKFETIKNELVRLNRKTMKVAWSEEKLTLPADVDYDDLKCCRYYLRHEVIKKFPDKDQMNGTFLPVKIADYGNETTDYCSNIETEDYQTAEEENCSNDVDIKDVGNYDYNNNNNDDTTDYCSNIETEDCQAGNKENCINNVDFEDDVGDHDCSNENGTTDYCPNIETEDHQIDNGENCNNGPDLEEDVAIATQGFTGDNLVEAPKMTNRIFIPFSLRAKTIDMRDLKRAVWEVLTSTEGDKENVDIVETSGDNNADKINGSKKFSDLVKNVPKVLTKSDAEVLSVPIAFMSLLHLANEKNLQIESSDDGSDLHIRQE